MLVDAKFGFVAFCLMLGCASTTSSSTKGVAGQQGDVQYPTWSTANAELRFQIMHGESSEPITNAVSVGTFTIMQAGPHRGPDKSGLVVSALTDVEPVDENDNLEITLNGETVNILAGSAAVVATNSEDRVEALEVNINEKPCGEKNDDTLTLWFDGAWLEHVVDFDDERRTIDKVTMGARFSGEITCDDDSSLTVTTEVTGTVDSDPNYPTVRSFDSEGDWAFKFQGKDARLQGALFLGEEAFTPHAQHALDEKAKLVLPALAFFRLSHSETVHEGTVRLDPKLETFGREAESQSYRITYTEWQWEDASNDSCSGTHTIRVRLGAKPDNNPNFEAQESLGTLGTAAAMEVIIESAPENVGQRCKEQRRQGTVLF